jgi:hypothetical protein
MQLRPYQIDISKKAANILAAKNIVYLSMEVRTGKTITALEVCRLLNYQKILFITKKKAITSITKDASHFNFITTVINKEQLPNCNDTEIDCVIVDEAHGYGAFPKPGKYAKELKKRFSKKPLVLLSGTPSPESYSQLYHQFWLSSFSPFPEKNFYLWAKQYVKVIQIDYGFGKVNDYSRAKEHDIKAILSPFMLAYSQSEVGFKVETKEAFLSVKMADKTYRLADRLKRDLVIVGNTGEIVADTAVKLQQKLHQIYSGTIKLDDGRRIVIDTSKAEYIQQYFAGKKIAIFYKFVAELEAIKKVFGDDITTELPEFDNSNKNIALQIVAGREGIKLSKAEALVFYNIDFSAVSYFQARDRMVTIDRQFNEVYWIFSENGIEREIYKAVTRKKDFTVKYFKQWLQSTNQK